MICASSRATRTGLATASSLPPRSAAMPVADPVSARVRERLGDMEDQRNISLIAIHQHGIPDSFPERVLAETAALKPFSPAGRTDLRNVPLDHHRSAGRARP